MSSKPIIEIKNLGKKYNITHQRGGYVALRDVLMNVIKSPFSFLKSKAKQAAGMESKEEFWALKDVNFEVNKGEVIGIIGKNGAGKSTLLKILSKITPPTTGEARITGRIGSLLEVGTGFHPELTGRENIFLNGAILGMTRSELVKKFDQIVEFAGIEKFLDTPVKYYSSGMYVRLAFSVAAHLEPDILIVDEVLAVGDAEFQKKCLGKMEEVSKKSGRTILFVSHNMSAVQKLCGRSILLEKGRVAMIGETSGVIDRYLSAGPNKDGSFQFQANPKERVSILSVSMVNKDGSIRSEFPINESFLIRINFECRENISDTALSFLIYSHDRDLLLYSSDSDMTGKLREYGVGKYEAEVSIPAFLFNIGKYSFDALIHTPNIFSYSKVQDIGFEIKNISNPRSIIFQGGHMGRIAVPLSYSLKKDK